MKQRTHNRLDEHQKRFVELIDQNSHRHRRHTVFTDFAELRAMAISNSVDRFHFERREARYMQIIKKYEREEVQRFPEMLACITNSLQDGFSDCFGRIFMALEMGDHFKGQYFSPYEIALLMAKMTFASITQDEIDARGGFITCSEPACGAGGMAVAVADTMQQVGINFQRCLHVTATDIDATAAHMAYVTLSLIGCPAIVIVGNSLTLEEREHFFTPMHIVGGWNSKLRARSEAQQRQVIMPERAPDEVQTSSLTEQREPIIDMDHVEIVAQRVEEAGQMALF